MTKPIYALLAGAVLGLLVIPFAAAGAESGPQARASVKKQLKKLKGQVRELQQQVNDLSRQPGPQGPAGPPGAQGAQGPQGPATGPAGGDLAGTYPNPLIAPDAVDGTKIANNAISEVKILDQAVTNRKVAANAITSGQILDGEVQTPDIGSVSVGADELKPVTPVVGQGVTVTAGTPRTTFVSCPPNQRIIGGGFAWTDDEPNSIIASAPSETSPNTSWIVRGIVDAGSNNLFAWADCLPL